MLTITYFVHGTTIDNEQGLASGWNDPPLSELGVKQCLDLKARIDPCGFDLVFCSDLSRAVQTADLVFGAHMQVVTDRRLRECDYGDFNGRPSNCIESVEAEHTTWPFPNGESFEDVRQRVAEFLTEAAGAHHGTRVALVAHRVPQLTLDVILKGMTWEEAFANDWRKIRSWQPGWEYTLG